MLEILKSLKSKIVPEYVGIGAAMFGSALCLYTLGILMGLPAPVVVLMIVLTFALWAGLQAFAHKYAPKSPPTKPDMRYVELRHQDRVESSWVMRNSYGDWYSFMSVAGKNIWSDAEVLEGKFETDPLIDKYLNKNSRDRSDV